MLSSNDLVELSKINLETIRPEMLKELTEIYIDSDMSIEYRIETFFEEINNPYCFLVNGTPVQISFNNHNKTLDECLRDYLNLKKDSDNTIL